MRSSLSFENDSVWRLILKNGIPAMLTIVIVIAYNLADTFFVGQTHNDMMVAAVSVAAPIFTLLITVGTLIGSGGCSIISRALGSKNEKRARQTSSFCFYASIFIGIIFAAVLWIGCNQILELIGATDKTIDMAAIYMKIIAIGAPFIVFSNTMANIIRADGATQESMIGNIIGTVLNLLLDPIIILGLQWGIAGAAAATVFGNICACVYYAVLLRRRKSAALSCSWKDFTMNPRISVPVFSIGLPGALSNLLMSVSNIIMNIFLPYGDHAVAAMGVAMKVGMIVAMLQMGLCMGVLPILAYNFGSGKTQRVKETIRKTGTICVGLGSAATLICFLTAHSLVKDFVTETETISLGVRMVYAIILSGPVLGLFFLTTNVMQAAGRSLLPTVVSLSRQGIVYVPCLYLFHAVWGLNGIIFTQAVFDMAATVLAVALCGYLLRKDAQKTEKADSFVPAGQ